MGYSGHAYVVYDIFKSQGVPILGYCEKHSKDLNPYNLEFLGSEHNHVFADRVTQSDYFVAIGDNNCRKNVYFNLISKFSKLPINAVHDKSSVSSTVKMADGIMIGDGAVINACSVIDKGVICNTQSVIEHECRIGSFSHIAPGAVLCGNVHIGSNTLVGARAVVLPGITVGDNVIIGAGSVVNKNIPDDSKVAGNPIKKL